MGRGTRRERGRIGRVSLALSSAALLACLVACTPVGAGDASPTPPPRAEPTPAPTSTLRPEVRPGTLPAVEAPIPPERLRISSLGVDMPVTNVGAEPSGQMELPVDPSIAGWYRYGPDSDHDAGNLLLAAHVDAVDYPIGPLAGLRDIAVGATMEVAASDGTLRTYVVESLTYYEKATLPVAELFARDGAPALVVITCGGPFDSSTGRYRDNVVAVARPA